MIFTFDIHESVLLMKKRFLFGLIALVACIKPVDVVYSQSSELEKNDALYKAWVIPVDNSLMIKGHLKETTNSSIIMFNSRTLQDQTFSFQQIEELRFRKKGRVLKGALIGALSGVVIGGTIGLASGDDEGGCFVFCYTKEEKALMGGISAAIPGTIAGAIIGSMKIKIPINGKTNFEKEKLEQYKY